MSLARLALPVCLLAALALPAAAPAASAPTAGHWRGESGASMQVAWTAEGRTLSGGRVLLPSGCGRMDGIVEQQLPALKVPASGRVTSMRRKDGGTRGYDLSLTLSGGKATGSFRYFHRGLRCDTGRKRFTVTAGAGAAGGSWKGSTEQDRAVSFVVERDGFSIGRLGRDGFGGAFRSSALADCPSSEQKIPLEISEGPATPLRADGSFAEERDFGDVKIWLKGTVGATTAQGTVRVTVTTSQGRCDSGAVAWTARRG